MTFPTYGSERDEVWTPDTCSICNPQSDNDSPCSPCCEATFVRERRQHRLASYRDALGTARKLAERYMAESGPSSVRLGAVYDRMRELEQLIADLSEAQERDDEATADTVRAPMAVAS